MKAKLPVKKRRVWRVWVEKANNNAKSFLRFENLTYNDAMLLAKRIRAAGITSSVGRDWTK